MRATLALLLVVSALASPPSAPEAAADLYGASMYFPVIGENHYSDTFGAPRSGGRSHHGVDIMAEKMTPVVAVADGTIGWMHNEIGGNCCAFALHHDDGWESWYIHLNNDTPGTDDGLGYGIVEGLESGSHVTAGQLIGWVGDSGNAEWAGSHLHFELHDPSGTVVNPTPHVDVAIVLEAPLDDNYAGHFRDDEESVHQENIDRIFEAGITRGCNPPLNDRYCPRREITRGQMAAFLRRNLELPAVEDDFFNDDGSSIFEGDINALAAAGVAFGCDEESFCADDPLLRDEFAEFFVRAYGYDNPDEIDFFVDDDGNPFEAAINKLANHGITLGCNPPDNDNYCPTRSLSREEMASFFVRALDLPGPDDSVETTVAISLIESAPGSWAGTAGVDSVVLVEELGSWTGSIGSDAVSLVEELGSWTGSIGSDAVSLVEEL
ncbi:MAG: M23 family metallopeptidase, partial [Acidimicrobiia bacterium]|nr:M23 family metallopeptidase [Acidimicrobiia bacterium]